MDDSDIDDEMIFQQSTDNQFLDGYADSDSIYDYY